MFIAVWDIFSASRLAAHRDDTFTLDGTGSKTIRDFNIRAGENDVADLQPVFAGYDELLQASEVVVLDGVTSTRIIYLDPVGDSVTLTLLGYDITRDANYKQRFLVGPDDAPSSGGQDDPASAHDDAYVTLQGHALSLGASDGVLANDGIAPPGTATLQIGPQHGVLQASGDGGFSYAPTAGFSGIDRFTYHASGADGSMDIAEAVVYVVPVVTGTSTTLDLLALSAEQQVAATYAAFLGRGADAGRATQNGSTLLANIASSFATSDEAKGLYSFLADPQGASDGQIGAFLDSVYGNLFNRSADAAGLAYWTGEVKQTLADGGFVGSVLVDIMSGAQDTAAARDITTLMSKVAVSLDYVHEQQAHDTAWAGDSDVAAATALLQAVTADHQSLLVGLKHVDEMIAAHA